jgi:TonB-linked SusC/RagA family outer membrane protein
LVFNAILRYLQLINSNNYTMKTKFNGILTLLLAFTVHFAFAQKTVSGTVSDETGPLPGVSVLIQGTQTGTETDFDGKYTITANEGDVLVYTFMGKKTKSVTVGSASVYNVSLEDSSEVLEEVVITGAYGIKRKPKSVTAGTETVSEKALTQTAPVSVTSALVGKVSGLDIYTGNNGVKPTTRVVLRGNRSLTGSNEALFVIDGIIAPKSAFEALNPNDVQKMTILKGAGATALYGPKASNGAVIITTKTGSNTDGDYDVNINSSIGFEQVKFLPTLQTEYGSGWNGSYDPFENTNWGPRLDGTVRPIGPNLIIDGALSNTYQTETYSAKNNVADFFKTGTSIVNNVSFSKGNKDSQFFFSASDTRVDGIVEKDEFDKNTFRINFSQKLSDKFNVRIGADYYRGVENVVGQHGSQVRPLYWYVLNTPTNIDLTKYRDWQNDLYSTPDNYFNEYYENPYWIIDQARNTNSINRLRGNINLKYEFTDWFNASYTIGTNNYSGEFKNTRGGVHYARPDLEGTARTDIQPSVYDAESRSNELQSDLLANFNFDINKDFNTTLTLGNHIETYKGKFISLSGNDLFIPDFYNSSVLTGEYNGSESVTRERNYAFFGDLTIGYKEFLYLNVTARNDWFSVLDKEHNNIFYPSVGLSFVPTDAFDLGEGSFLNYLKVYANYAEVGNVNALSAYKNQELFFVPTGFPFGSTIGLSLPNQIVQEGLRPERTKSRELGINTQFFNKRVGLDFTVYKTNSVDQILSAGVSSAAGGTTLLTNVGDVENKGMEIDLRGKVFVNPDGFNWDVSLNYANNQNEVLSLSDGAEELNIYGYTNGSAGIYAVKGMAFPQLKASAYARDDQGRILIDPNTGNPIKAAQTKTFGTTAPPEIYGLRNDFSYKNLSLSVVMDYKTGHVFYNNLVDALEFTGRVTGRPREPFVFPNSAYETSPGVYVANTNIPVSQPGNVGLYEAFWGEIYGDINENYVVDASAIKVREIALTYNLPEKLIGKTPLERVSVGLVARNILMWRPASNIYTDPEFYTGNTNAIGFGTQDQTPPTGTYGFKLNIQL